ncbi:CheR family methyltransferase [Dyella choica]|nr:protein-glutamate O-methyltransferase CheR [Dyella choica]
MTLEAIEQLLKDTMGLDAASIGRSAVARATQERMSASGLSDHQVYWAQLNASAHELQELIEAVVVPETWFFRDKEVYRALASVVRDGHLQNAIQCDTLRLLSLPCSTGEEPYSIAMTLLECGFPLDRFVIDAVDISTRSLALARSAVYGANSFRSGDLGFRQTHFEQVGTFWHLHDRIRQAVRFQLGNVLGSDFFPGEAIYHVIFCRNLLIYFDRATQEACIKVLLRLLKPEGYLFIGPAESGVLLSHRFISAKIANAFVFRPPSSMPAAKAPVAVSKSMDDLVRQRAAPAATRPSIPSRHAPATRPTIERQPAVSMPPDSRDAITRLADQGHLDEASKACEAHIQAHGLSAWTCHLMGLIRQAAGNARDAIPYFRKALYLDPNHYEAMTHLALLLEKQGDATGAQAMQRRLKRLTRQPGR